MATPNRVMLSGAWNPGAGDDRISGGGVPAPTNIDRMNNRLARLSTNLDGGFRKYKKMHTGGAGHNYFFLELGQWKLEDQLMAIQDNFGYNRTLDAVKLAYKKIKPGIRRTLKVYIPKKAPPKRIRGVPSAWSNYAPTHKNHKRYLRRGGELRKSIDIRQAKAKWPFYPYLMVKIEGFPWVFLRKKTKLRYTGRRGGKVSYRGFIPERIRLTGWANNMHLLATQAIYLSLTRYAGLGNPWIMKPVPPKIPDVSD